MDYMGILTAAAKTNWKDKIIYIFQLVFMSVVPLLSLLAMGVFVTFLDTEHPERMLSFFSHPLNIEDLPIFLALAAAYLLLMLFNLFCTTVGYIGALKGAALSEQGVEVNFAMLWRASLKYFWRAAAVFVLAGAIGIAVMIVLMIPAVITPLFFVLPFCIFVPLFLIGKTMVEMLLAAIVNDDLGLAAAFGRLWQIVQDQVGPLALMTFLLLAIDTAAYFVTVMPVSVIQQIAMQSVIPFQQDLSSITPGGIFRWMFIFQLLIYPIMLALQAIFQTFHLSAVSLFYVRITPKPVLPEVPVLAPASE
jgi:hypothetical protein